MICRNPACPSELFKARLRRKEIIKGIPMLPVELTCGHCGHKLKAWVTNENLKYIHDQLNQIKDTLKDIRENLERPPKKGLFARIFSQKERM